MKPIEKILHAFFAAARARSADIPVCGFWGLSSPQFRAMTPNTELEYLFSVAAGVPPAVEPGILPGGLSCGLRRYFRVNSPDFGRQDAALYGSQDGCRYS